MQIPDGKMYWIWVVALISCLPGYAQKKFTFYEDIAPIIHRNCTPCHSPGNPGPFNLITYEDVAKRGKFVAYVTRTRYMPPWHADPDFQHYRNERRLTDAEINAINQWFTQGMKPGKEKKAALPVNGPAITRPPADLTLTMQQAFRIPGTNTEEFRFFNVPTNLPEDTYITSIEFVPGNPQRVHHARIMVDTTNRIRGIDGLSERDPAVYQFQREPLADEFLYGWVPGNFPVFFPEGTGKHLPRNADLILNIHYAPSPVEEEDQSAVKLYFARKPVDRAVQTLTLNEEYISNQPFVLPAESSPTFYLKSDRIPRDISLLSVLPHMHVLGKTFKAYAITPRGEVVNLIKVDAWDYRWQTTYQFVNLIHIPKNSIIYAEASYDNTSANPENPNRPPKDVTYGWGSTDEMMNLILYYVDYRPGDEVLSLGPAADKQE